MKTKILIILLVLSLGVNVGTLITVVYHSNKPKIHKQWRQHPLSEKLDLSQEQIGQIENIKTKSRQATVPLRDTLIMKRKELISLLKRNPSDSIKSDSLIREIANLQIQMESYVLNDMRDIMKNLTPEQSQKFCECFEEKLHCPRKSMRCCPMK
ncbi:MAG: periplasmic heavy metal sensor [bacterium]|nr:periplasmic heavy metal sensor [bacterium]